jgi:hypothetical protein
MVFNKNTSNKTVQQLMAAYGYAERQSVSDIKELASALLSDLRTKQHGFELILGRPVAVNEIANNNALLAIWNTQADTKTTIENLELQRSVEALSC